jgi:glycerol-3-phosphate dehydrogenase
MRRAVTGATLGSWRRVRSRGRCEDGGDARRAHGALVLEVQGAANTREDLGRDVGADLTKAEVRYLVRREWAVSAADILWRRTKVGLRLSQAAVASVDEYLKQLLADLHPAE